MIRQLASEGLKLLVPQFTDSITVYSEVSHEYNHEKFQITKESLIELDSPKIGNVFSNIEVDILGYVKNFQFVIYVTYKGRDIPVELKTPDMEKTGIIEINLEKLLPAFKLEKKGKYINVLKSFIEESSEGKSWIYHPRYKNQKKEAEKKSFEWLLQQRHTESIQEIERVQPYKVHHKVIKLTPREAYDFECKKCGSLWHSESNYCQKCKTHLYVVSK